MDLPDAAFDVVARDLQEAGDREPFDDERAHRRADDHGPTQVGIGEVVGAGEPTHEAAGEGVPCPGGIEDRLERIRRREEYLVAGEHERAMLALLDEHGLRALVHDPARRLHEVGTLGELARLAVVERDEVDMLEQFEHVGAPRLDPEVHRVAGDELGRLHLPQHLELETRVDVGEEDVLGVGELRRDLRLEVREDAEAGLEGLGRVEVVAIAAPPAERLALHLLQTGEVDAACLEGLELLDRIVAADHANELDRGLVRGRGGEVVRGPTEDVVGFAERGLDGIKGDGADDEDGHQLGGGRWEV